MTPEHYALTRALYKLFEEQAAWAKMAMRLAKVELGIAAKRKTGGNDSAKTRRTNAAPRDAAMIDEANKRQRKNPRMSMSDLARHLADKGHGKAETIRRKLPKLLA